VAPFPAAVPVSTAVCIGGDPGDPGPMRDALRAVVHGLHRRGWPLGLYAAGVVLVPLGASLSSSGAPAVDGIDVDVVSSPAEPARSSPERLRVLCGIWSRWEAGGEGERVRFYYFHGDGTGLYRYGRVGLTNTHSFDYDIRDDRLILDFRKTGEHHEVDFVLTPGESEGARDWLELRDDPRELGTTRYFRESDETVRADDAHGELGPVPAGHMWIDLKPFATGGRGFVMYQLRPAGIDGRGVGWFHRGDFNDWSTESLTYRIVGSTIELHFSLEEGWRENSTFAVTTDEEGARWLELADDPRDFWHPHRYVDMGPSFGAALAPLELSRRR